MREVMEALQPALHAIDAGQHKRGGDPQTDFLMRYSAAWVYATMATIAVSLLEKEKQYQEACELLRKLLGRWPRILLQQTLAALQCRGKACNVPTSLMHCWDRRQVGTGVSSSTRVSVRLLPCTVLAEK